MQTPIADFVKKYAENRVIRLHMPGHKGMNFLGCEEYDITEIFGADSLYEADGIIRESEENATKLFGTQRTVFGTEGSSQCIRAMLYLITKSKKQKGRPVVLAARNVHKAFVYAAALLDIEVVWLWQERMSSLCSCPVSARYVEKMLSEMNEAPEAVYLTSPDYLGNVQDVKEIADVCHKYQVKLLVDHAHGSYTHFLEKPMHPMDLGADLCCDSAHKTLPVLTGGAYLHIGQCAPASYAADAKDAMALFGSTSPSYLILSSLDLCNRYLSEHYYENLKQTTMRIVQLKRDLIKNGWKVVESDPLKLTIRMPKSKNGIQEAKRLFQENIIPEYADDEYIVFMFTPELDEKSYAVIENALGVNKECYREETFFSPAKGKQICSIREAVFAPREKIPVQEAVGRICGVPTVSCPPAIPIVVSGEMITKDSVALFKKYHIKTIDVLKG